MIRPPDWPTRSEAWALETLDEAGAGRPGSPVVETVMTSADRLEKA